jgi:NAD(P)-dependent dehydrogenase (short-subunit alcohol dehydrogenase family)
MGKTRRKMAIVTGGSRGIGKALARGLAAAGAKIVIAARGVENLNQATREFAAPGATVVPIPADVTNEFRVTALFTRTLGRKP